METVQLGRLQLFLDMGRIDASKTITLKTLVDSGLVTCSRVKHGVKLLGNVSSASMFFFLFICFLRRLTRTIMHLAWHRARST